MAGAKAVQMAAVRVVQKELNLAGD